MFIDRFEIVVIYYVLDLDYILRLYSKAHFLYLVFQTTAFGATCDGLKVYLDSWAKLGRLGTESLIRFFEDPRQLTPQQLERLVGVTVVHFAILEVNKRINIIWISTFFIIQTIIHWTKILRKSKECNPGTKARHGKQKTFLPIFDGFERSFCFMMCMKLFP